MVSVKETKRATTIEKIYVERGFEGALRWIEERRQRPIPWSWAAV
jgi:hypothetical protein